MTNIEVDDFRKKLIATATAYCSRFYDRKYSLSQNAGKRKIVSFSYRNFLKYTNMSSLFHISDDENVSFNKLNKMIRKNSFHDISEDVIAKTINKCDLFLKLKPLSIKTVHSFIETPQGVYALIDTEKGQLLLQLKTTINKSSRDYISCDVVEIHDISLFDEILNKYEITISIPVSFNYIRKLDSGKSKFISGELNESQKDLRISQIKDTFYLDNDGDVREFDVTINELLQRAPIIGR